MSCSRKAGLRRARGVSFGICTIIAFSTHAMGQPSARAPASQQQSPATTYAPGQIYLQSSRVYVYVGKTGFGHEHGVVGRIKKGSIRLGVGQDAGQIVFDMASFEADTERARKYVGLSGTTDESTKRKVNANMRGSGVLGLSRHSTASFTIKSSQPLSEESKRGFPQYRLDGNLTLHGVTQPVSIIADVQQKGGWLRLRGGFSILQTKYGITPFTKAFGAVGITDQLKIWGDIWIAGPQGVTMTATTTKKR